MGFFPSFMQCRLSSLGENKSMEKQCVTKRAERGGNDGNRFKQF